MNDAVKFAKFLTHYLNVDSQYYTIKNTKVSFQ